MGIKVGRYGERSIPSLAASFGSRRRSVSPARLRPLAETDLVKQTQHYRSMAGPETGERFFEAAIDALHTIENMPGIGSLRLGELCNVPGLRSLQINRFPHGWFYLERHEYVDVVRLLSYAQDLPSLLIDPNDGRLVE